MISNSYQELVELCKISRVVALELGCILKRCRNEEVWTTDIGIGIDTWYDFLAQPEIGLSTREANALIETWEYAVQNSIDDGSVSQTNLKILAAKNTSDQQVINDAKVLTPKDFKERYYERSHGDNAPKTYTYMVMRRCKETGNLEKVHGVEHETVLERLGDKI